jgi:hypothetical protein
MMIDRARDIAKTMGYSSIDAILTAIGSGELILVKATEGQRSKTAEWIRAQLATVRGEDVGVAGTLEDIADALELAMELAHYPADADICDMDLPYGWPSYCERSVLQ